MTGDRFDVLVVGGGILGAACAWYLVREGLRVGLAEASFGGSGATGAAMGHLVVMDDSPPQLALTAWSLELWRELLERAPVHCEDDPCGTLWVAADGEEMDLVEAKATAYREVGLEGEIVDGPSLAALEPALRPGLAGALRVPGDRVIYPPGAVRWLLDEVRGAGGEVLEEWPVERMEPGGVRGPRGELRARHLVNAAGALAPRLLPGLPVEPRKGHLAITARYPGFARHQLVEVGYLKSAHTLSAESVAFNLQPRTTGQYLVGSSRELVGWEAEINRELLSRMLRRAVGYAPALEAMEVIRVWTGFRPATPDKLPLVGPVEGTGLWVAAGHEGLGITMATGSARLLADLILGRTPALDPEPYDPRRFAAASPREAG